MGAGEVRSPWWRGREGVEGSEESVGCTCARTGGGGLEGQVVGAPSLQRALKTSLVLSGDRSGASGRVSEGASRGQAGLCGTEALVPGTLVPARPKRWLWASASHTDCVSA